MKCPECGGVRTGVFDTVRTDIEVERRRKCLDCGSRFLTSETFKRFAGRYRTVDGRPMHLREAM